MVRVTVESRVVNDVIVTVLLVVEGIAGALLKVND